MTYIVTWSRQAKRALEGQLPEGVAVACFEFITTALAANPRRVGKALHGPLSDWHSARRGEFRVIYQILESEVRVHVIDIRHRSDAYRRR